MNRDRKSTEQVANSIFVAFPWRLIFLRCVRALLIKTSATSAPTPFFLSISLWHQINECRVQYKETPPGIYRELS